MKKTGQTDCKVITVSKKAKSGDKIMKYFGEIQRKRSEERWGIGINFIFFIAYQEPQNSISACFQGTKIAKEFILWTK